MKHYLTLVALMFSTVWVFGQQAGQFTLQQAIDYAMSNNTEVKISQNNIRDAEKQITERTAAGLPQINGTVSYNYYAVIPTTILPEQFAIDPTTGQVNPNFDRAVKFGVKNNLTGTASLSTLLFDGSYLVALQAAREYRDYAHEELKSKQYTVKNQVTMAYLPVLLINLSLETLDKNIANLQNLSKEVTAIYNQGLGEQLDVDRINLSLSNLTTEKDNLLRQKDITINYLKFVMNYPVDKPIEIVDNISSIESKPADGILSGKISYDSRSEYGVIKKGIRLNELNVKVNKAGYLPSLVAIGSFQYNIQDDKFFSKDAIASPTAIIGGQLNIPIFDSFAKKAKTERARIQMLNALEQKNMFERSVDLEVTNARQSYNAASERLEMQRKNVALAEKIYNTTKTKYQHGLGSSLEITQAEQSLYSVQQNFNQALYDVIVAKINLDKAFGK